MLAGLPAKARVVTQHCPRWHKLTVSGVSRLPTPHIPSRLPISRRFSTNTVRQQDAATATVQRDDDVLSTPTPARDRLARIKQLPRLCPGCGAHSQTVEPDAAGYYDVSRSSKAVQKKQARVEEDGVFAGALSRGAFARDDGIAVEASPVLPAPSLPLCTRCHDLRHYSRGTSIVHPSMHSIQQIIEESPHTHNHIYHVLDAADFPMSLIPNLEHSLDLPRLRTQNRRSKTSHFTRGRVADVSFIITRSDLLAPKKEQVDALMPYLQLVLRDALSRRYQNVRLGNVRCVSAKRGWWTRTVKEELWERGGAGWMVGKVNVGKSALFEVVFPKGRSEPDINLDKLRSEPPKVMVMKPEETFGAQSAGELADGAQENESDAQLHDPEAGQEGETQEANASDLDALHDEEDPLSLLPPAQSETQYPTMPLVSSLPGTTASPIRIPFGNGKGELIDLPGVHRSSLNVHVKEDVRGELIMKHRIAPEQHTIKPGQSLLLGGGLVRITPTTDQLITLAYPFLPPALDPHVTSNERAVAIQTGVYPVDAKPSMDGEPRAGLPYAGNVSSVLHENSRTKLESAGVFKLEWDVTKRRSGSLTDRTAGKQKAADLPFIVYSADLLVEGCGWVELVCQVRKRSDSLLPSSFPPSSSAASGAVDALGHASELERRGGGRPSRGREDELPAVEVFTPEGKYVGIRRPMNAWLLGGPKKVAAHARRSRPRQTIAMVKRRTRNVAL